MARASRAAGAAKSRRSRGASGGGSSPSAADNARAAADTRASSPRVPSPSHRSYHDAHAPTAPLPAHPHAMSVPLRLQDIELHSPSHRGTIAPPTPAKKAALRQPSSRRSRAPRRTQSEALPSTSTLAAPDHAAESGGGSGKENSSRYRGVAIHKSTGRWEAHLWAHGQQLYLGSFASEETAARVFDRACLRVRPRDAAVKMLNFPPSDYDEAMKQLNGLSCKEAIVKLRRESQGFSRGTSSWRGVSWRPSTGRWEARIGKFLGQRYQYLGTFATGEDAARAYDRAAIASRGRKAVTNYNVSEYAEELRLLESCKEEDMPAMQRHIAFDMSKEGKCSRASSKPGATRLDATRPSSIEGDELLLARATHPPAPAGVAAHSRVGSGEANEATRNFELLPTAPSTRPPPLSELVPLPAFGGAGLQNNQRRMPHRVVSAPAATFVELFHHPSEAVVLSGRPMLSSAAATSPTAPLTPLPATPVVPDVSAAAGRAASATRLPAVQLLSGPEGSAQACPMLPPVSMLPPLDIPMNAGVAPLERIDADAMMADGLDSCGEESDDGGSFASDDRGGPLKEVPLTACSVLDLDDAAFEENNNSMSSALLSAMRHCS